MKRVAFVSGGVGKYGHEPEIFKCGALAESLYRVGGWRGNMYIMSDSPKIRAYENDFNSLIEDVRGDGRIKMLKMGDMGQEAGGRGGSLKASMLLHPSVKEEILIWHDCDKLVVKTGCVPELFRDGPFMFEPATPGDPVADVLIGTDASNDTCKAAEQSLVQRSGLAKPSHFCGDSIHIGVMAVQRNNSEEMMARWLSRINRVPKFDRYTLYDTWKLDSRRQRKNQPQSRPKAFSVQQLPAGLCQGNRACDPMWSGGEKKGCIMHLTNKRMSVKRAQQNISTLVKSLGLTLQSNKITGAYLAHKDYLKKKLINI
jgi:hypothetical protein